MARRTVISQLTSAGEDAVGRLVQSPVTHKAIEGALQVKERVEKLVAGFADMDGRVSRIEQRLDALEKSQGSAAPRARSAAAKPRSTSTRKPRTSQSEPSSS
jgi:hypothetical protein